MTEGPRGGGQPGDTGSIGWSGGPACVTETRPGVRVAKTESEGWDFKRMRIELVDG